MKKIDIIKSRQKDFPGSPVVKSLPAHAGESRFDPWSRRIPHDAGQLNLCAMAAEPTSCNC